MNVNAPYGALIVAVKAPSIVPAVGVIVIGVAIEARPKPSLIVNAAPVTPTGSVTATATGPGTCTLITSSVVPLTVIGVAVAILIANEDVPVAAIVIELAPVPVVGVTVMPVPARIEVGLLVYDMLFPYTILHSLPLNIKDKLPYGVLIVDVPPSTFCAVPCTIIGSIVEALPLQSLTT